MSRDRSSILAPIALVVLVALVALVALFTHSDAMAVGTRGPVALRGNPRFFSGASVRPDAGTDALEVVLVSGQSLSLGAGTDGGAALSTDAAYSLTRHAYSGASGYNGTTAGTPTSYALVENRDDQNARASPRVEAPTTGMMAQAVSMGGLDEDSAVILCGRSGAPYSELKENGDGTESGVDSANWECLENLLTDLVSDVAPREVVVKALVVNHGEADTYYLHSQEYASYMVELQASADASLKDVITGQADPIPLVMSQVNSASAYDNEHQLMAQAQLDAADNPHIYVSGPKSYWLTPSDTKHLINTSYRRLGESIGTMLSDLFRDGAIRQPLRPSSASASGSVITISFTGCTPPLVLDSTTVSTTGLDTHGFRIYEAGGRTISSVAVDGCDVELTLSGTVYSGTQVAYAYGCPSSSACSGAGHGPTTGQRGTLRDSAGYTSWSGGAALYNWAVAFGPSEVTVTGGAAGPLTVTRSIDFDGTGDVITRADEADLDTTGNAFGICAWVYVEGVVNQFGIASKSTNADCSWGFYLGTNGRILLTVCSGASDDAGANFAFTAIGDVTTSAWTHVCAGYDGGQGTASNRPRFWKNGAVSAHSITGTPPATVRNSAAAFRVGQYRDGNDAATDAAQRSANGRISNVVYWRGVRPSDTAISDLYNAGVPRTPVGVASGAIDSNLRLWLRLGDGYRTTTGVITGTPEGYSGNCTGATNSACASATGALVPIEGAIGTHEIYNSAPSYSSLRFDVTGNPTFPTSHP